MKFALHLASLNFPDAAGAARVARAAEAAGFDSVLAIDHVVLPQHYESIYPYSANGRMPAANTAPYVDPLIWMAFAAAATSTIKLMTGVIILPQREPLALAKQVATLDFMSGGRIELGIGVGWLKEEFAAIGVPFEKRGKRADEYIGAMRALWASDGASYHGEFVNFDKVNSNPKPVRGDVPIIVGGHSEAAARRAGRLGQGFFLRSERRLILSRFSISRGVPLKPPAETLKASNALPAARAPFQIQARIPWLPLKSAASVERSGLSCR